MKSNTNICWLPFLFLLLGTIGLLLNEFAVKLDTACVIISALLNLIGLFMLFVYPGYIRKR